MSHVPYSFSLSDARLAVSYAHARHPKYASKIEAEKVKQLADKLHAHRVATKLTFREARDEVLNGAGILPFTNEGKAERVLYESALGKIFSMLKVKMQARARAAKVLAERRQPTPEVILIPGSRQRAWRF